MIGNMHADDGTTKTWQPITNVCKEFGVVALYAKDSIRSIANATYLDTSEPWHLFNLFILISTQVNTFLIALL